MPLLVLMVAGDDEEEKGEYEEVRGDHHNM